MRPFARDGPRNPLKYFQALLMIGKDLARKKSKIIAFKLFKYNVAKIFYQHCFSTMIKNQNLLREFQKIQLTILFFTMRIC